MKKWLVVLLALASSSVSSGAEDIVYNGKKGVFIEEEKAKEILKQVGEELPSLRKQKNLLESQVERQKELIGLERDKCKVESDISKTWRKNFVALSETAEKEDDTLDPYITTLIFSGGVAAGMATVYLTLYLLEHRP